MILDVSYHQGAIDWEKAKAADVEAAIIKATGEETAGPVPFKDSRFLGNWRMAKDAGIRVGAYHFMDGERGSGSGLAEANFFLETVEMAGGFQPGDIRPVLDVEWPPGRLFDVTQLAECANHVWERCGKAPIIYTGRWYWDRIQDRDFFDWLGGCPLWIAGYTKTCPSAPKPWLNVALWQFTDKGRVDGIAGPVDLNKKFVAWEEITL